MKDLKEKIIIAAIVIGLTFLMGYLTVQATNIFRDLFLGDERPEISLELQ